MKKLLSLLSALALTFGCYNDSDIREELREHEARLTTLETLCQQANSNIEALQTAVSALEKNVYVSAIVPVKKNGEVIGYAISFTNAETITIYHGQDGDKGEQGEKGNDGATPAVGLKQDADGTYYWTLNGEWLLDDSGKKVPASGKDGADGLPGASGPQGAAGKDGVTPQLKIEEGYWYVSYDGGKTWSDEPLGAAGASDDESIFTEVTYDTDYVYLTLADGEKLTLPRKTGETGDETANPATVTIAEITAATATFTGHLDVPASDLPFSKVTIYYSDAAAFNVNTAESESAITFDSEQNFTIILKNLRYGTKYNYCVVADVKSEGIYGEVLNFTTNAPSVEACVKETPVVSALRIAEFEGNVTGLSLEDKDFVKVGVAYSSVSEELKSDKSEKIYVSEYASSNSFAVVSRTLLAYTKYYYCCFLNQGESYTYFDIKEFQTLHPYSAPAYLDVASATDLSSSASANCYIVSKSGLYKFKTVKGNSSTSVGSVASASILWETFGTDITPEAFDLIKVSYADGYIAFQTADTFKEGNAVVAAKDASGNILWSWHIWLTDQPQTQVYNNNAGMMMDRNLGATSATPGDVGALGLLYQWGRKDPFLSSCSIELSLNAPVAESTITWPSPVVSDSNTGTIEYSIMHPTTIITQNELNYDWYYTGSSSTENNRWTAKQGKSIYDPCPAGWRIPVGGPEGIWAKAVGSSAIFRNNFDSENMGMQFTNIFGGSSSIWYPASGYRERTDGSLCVGRSGYYWADAALDTYGGYCLKWQSGGGVDPSYGNKRAYCNSVRCSRE